MAPKLNNTEKVIAILKAFLPDNHPRGIRELGQDLGIDPGTVSRIISILKKNDLLQQRIDRKYQLGELFGKLGEAFNQSKTAHRLSIIKPQLMVLNKQLDETVNFEILYGNDVKSVISLHGYKSVQPVRRSETWTGINASAGAKAMLAFLASNRLEVIKKAHPVLQKFRPNTITEWRKLEDQLEEIKKTGIAYDHDELREGICAIAAPVFDGLGSVFGAITVTVPLQREDIISDKKTIKLLKETAINMTSSLSDL